LPLLLGLTAACSGSSDSPSTPTPPPPSVPPSYAISDVTAVNAGTDGSCGGNTGDGIVIDQISFRFENPAARNLVGTRVYHDGSVATFMGTVGVCAPEMCQAANEVATPEPASACIVEGTATSTSGRITLFTRQPFLPTTTYGVRLVELVNPPSVDGAIVSNLATTSIVRLPGRANEVAAFYKVDVKPAQRFGTGYVGEASAVFYRPLPAASQPRGLEVQFAWFHGNGRLFGITRSTLREVLPGTLRSTASSAVPASLAPPWRLVIRFREMQMTVPDSRNAFSCYSDGPSGPLCTTDALPAPAGPVLSEDVVERSITQLQ
jgi:hypothetical protein